MKVDRARGRLSGFLGGGFASCASVPEASGHAGRDAGSGAEGWA